MSPKQAVPSQRTHSRRQRVPPALVRGNERFEGLAILEELPDDLGLLLFRSLRNVLIWSQLEPAERTGAFSPDAAHARGRELAARSLAPELLGPLGVIAALLSDPVRVDGSRLANACRRVALWAEDRGALGTALDFTQAAALVRPTAAPLAYAVGRLARRRAEYDRAESWFTRAIIQARQSDDWRSYALAFSGLGNLHVQRGNYPAARKAHLRSLRAANRHGVAEMQAIACHDLFSIAGELGAREEAEHFAERAFRAYGPDSPKLPRLAYDVANWWALGGAFARSLKVARVLEPRFTAPAERVLVLGLVARAAGGAGHEAEFETAAARVWEMVRGPAVPDTAAGALLGLAHGAASLGRWSMAQEAARRSMAVADERGEGMLVLAAEAALEGVRAEAAASRAAAAAQAEAPTPADRLADEFLAALSGAPAPVLVG
jgi:tetratricopeptide (TPR) repeat protein